MGTIADDWERSRRLHGKDVPEKWIKIKQSIDDGENIFIKKGKAYRETSLQITGSPVFCVNKCSW